MKINKISLLAFVCLMPFAQVVCLNEMSSAIMKSTVNSILVLPVYGAVKGFERRVLNKKIKIVQDQLTTEEQAIFNQNYDSTKIDTKPFTTATGPLAAVLALSIPLVAVNPAVGSFVGGSGLIASTALAVAAKQGQAHNDATFKKVVSSINMLRATKKQLPINENVGLSDFEKMFCVQS